MTLIQEHVLFYGWCVSHGQSPSCPHMQLAAHTQLVMGWDILMNPPLCWGWLGLCFWRSHPFYSQTMFFSHISLRFICKLLVD